LPNFRHKFGNDGNHLNKTYTLPVMSLHWGFL